MEKENFEVKLDEKALSAITGKVQEELSKNIADTVNAAFEAKAKAEVEAKEKELEKSEKVVKKTIDAPAIKKFGDIEKEAAGVRLIKALKAYSEKDFGKLKEYNEFNRDLKAKAGYQNTATAADGGYVELDPDFEPEVEKIASSYGVWSRTSVRRINGADVKTNKRGSSVSMAEVGQGASIAGTKMTIDQLTASLRKFAGIAPMTYEMSEDAAVDFRQTLIEDFAEEDARIMDTMVLTDTNSTNPGILRADDTNAVTVGAAITSVTWDHLLDARHVVPTRDIGNGVYVMHPTVWNILLKQKDSQNRYQSFPTQVGAVTPWGDTVLFSDVMPASSVVGDANEPYIVYGDLRRIRTYIKNGLRIEESMDATVTDVDSNTINLFEQDMKALRIVRRAVVLHKFPNAFTIIGTGTVS